MEICYACEKEAISREHVPPRVFFPERKDLPLAYPDFRKNLITVPSCADHNLTKSNDDQYAFMVVVASFDTNHIARRHFHKVVRSIKYRNSLSKFYLGDFTPVKVNGLNSIAPKIQFERIQSFLYLLSKGIYYSHFRSRWVKDFSIFITSLFMSPKHSKNYLNYNNQILNIREMTNNLFAKEEVFGRYPEIIRYQFHRDPETGSLILRFLFYGGFEVIASEKESR